MVNPLAGLGAFILQGQQALGVGRAMTQVAAQGRLASAGVAAGRGAGAIGEMMTKMADPKTVKATKSNIHMFRAMRRARGVIMMFSGVLDKLIILQPVLALLGAMVSLIGAGITEELMPYLQDWAEWLKDPDTQEALKNVGRVIGRGIVLIIEFIRWIVDTTIKMDEFVDSMGGSFETYLWYFQAMSDAINEQGGIIQSYLRVFGDLIEYFKTCLHFVGKLGGIFEAYNTVIEKTIELVYGGSPGLIPAFETLNSLIPTTTGLFGDLSNTIDMEAIPEIEDLIDLLGKVKAPSWSGGGGGGRSGKDQGLIPDYIPILGGLQHGGIPMKPMIAKVAEKEPEAVIPLTKLNHMFSDLRAGLENLLTENQRLRKSVETEGNWDW